MNAHRDVPELRGSLAGEVLVPSDPEYERARRGFNLLIDRRPAAIARCVTASDVVNAFAFAQAEGLEGPSAAEVTTLPGTAPSTTAW